MKSQDTRGVSMREAHLPSELEHSLGHFLSLQHVTFVETAQGLGDVVAILRDAAINQRGCQQRVRRMSTSPRAYNAPRAVCRRRGDARRGGGAASPWMATLTLDLRNNHEHNRLVRRALPPGDKSREAVCRLMSAHGAGDRTQVRRFPRSCVEFISPPHAPQCLLPRICTSALDPHHRHLHVDRDSRAAWPPPLPSLSSCASSATLSTAP